MAKAAYRGKVTITDREAKGKLGGVEQKVMAEDNRGRKVMVKSMSTDHVLSEYLCSALAKKLGLKANEVKVFAQGQKLGLRNQFCSIHTWIEDFRTTDQMHAEYIKLDYTKAQAERDEGWQRGMKFFDNLISNCDRHTGNYGYTVSDGYLMLIDHGHARPWESDYCRRYRADNAGFIDETKWILNADLYNRKADYKVGKMFIRFIEMTKIDFQEIVDALPKAMLDYYIEREMIQGETANLPKQFVKSMLYKQHLLMDFYINAREAK